MKWKLVAPLRYFPVMSLASYKMGRINGFCAMQLRKILHEIVMIIMIADAIYEKLAFAAKTKFSILLQKTLSAKCLYSTARV